MEPSPDLVAHAGFLQRFYAKSRKRQGKVYGPELE
jgi:hypothetical protein